MYRIFRVRSAIQNDKIEGEGCGVDSSWEPDDFGSDCLIFYSWEIANGSIRSTFMIATKVGMPANTFA